MKNLKKILAVMTSVVAICTSMTAFAANASEAYTPTGVENVFTFTYDNATATINNLTLGSNVKAGDVTILVTNDVERQSVTESNILYIDQSTKDAGFNAAMGLISQITFTEEEKAKTEPTTKNFPVYVGYNSETGFAIANGKIVATYTPASQDTTVTVKFVMGDVDGKNGVSPTDADLILAKLVGGSSNVGGYYTVVSTNEQKAIGIGDEIETSNGTKYIFGDVDGKNGVSPTDADLILAKLVGGSSNVGGAADIGAELTLTIPSQN